VLEDEKKRKEGEKKKRKKCVDEWWGGQLEGISPENTGWVRYYRVPAIHRQILTPITHPSYKFSPTPPSCHEKSGPKSAFHSSDMGVSSCSSSCGAA